MPSVECEGPRPKNTSLCGNGYEMDQKLTTATVLKIKQNSQCTRMKTKNYKASSKMFDGRLDGWCPKAGQNLDYVIFE